MRAVAVLALFALIAAPEAAWARYDYCYWQGKAPHAQNAPADSLTREGSPSGPKLASAIIYELAPSYYRVQCGTADERDFQLGRAKYEAVGCSPSSSVGRTVEGVLSNDEPQIEGYMTFELLRREHPDEFKAACKPTRLIDPLVHMPSDYPPMENPMRPAILESNEHFYEAERRINALRRKYPELVERAKILDEERLSRIWGEESPK